MTANWLDDQIAAAHAEFATWPAWKQVLAVEVMNLVSGATLAREAKDEIPPN